MHDNGNDTAQIQQGHQIKAEFTNEIIDMIVYHGTMKCKKDTRIYRTAKQSTEKTQKRDTRI